MKVLGTMALGIAAILAVISIIGHSMPAFVVTAMMVLTITGVGLRIYAAIRGAAARQAPTPAVPASTTSNPNAPATPRH